MVWRIILNGGKLTLSKLIKKDKIHQYDFDEKKYFDTYKDICKKNKKCLHWSDFEKIILDFISKYELEHLIDFKHYLINKKRLISEEIRRFEIMISYCGIILAILICLLSGMISVLLAVESPKDIYENNTLYVDKEHNMAIPDEIKKVLSDNDVSQIIRDDNTNILFIEKNKTWDDSILYRIMECDIRVSEQVWDLRIPDKNQMTIGYIAFGVFILFVFCTYQFLRVTFCISNREMKICFFSDIIDVIEEKEKRL